MKRRSSLIFLTAIAALLLLAAYMVMLAGSAPVVRRLNLIDPQLPRSTEPLRILLMSDFHVSTPGDTPRRLDSTVKQANALRPDLILLAGDFIATGTLGVHRPGPGHSVAPLARLRARLGTFAVLGNHDYSYPTKLRRLLKEMGIRTLDNESVRAGPVAVVGISDAASRHDNVAAAFDSWKRSGGIPIVLTHSPDVITRLPKQFSVMLAGHTHCGQVRLPLLGAIVTSSRLGQRYACGIVRDAGRISVITAGLGTSGLPIRLGASPDIWLITLAGSGN
jgi:uncharacterized protein